ncbi:hypothetical protein C8F04DRAFT_1310928 [Mycena alexandri]|uniref:Uncharacterized protein n=1 Tax=Mycena alexandri TaxID=1745969 RepID=A0AAD6X9N8_9AGAR|nr:hypothetical protein C8F04DRAFT_1310928 [Mycena alexandri]
MSFYDHYYSATTLSSITADEDHTLQFPNTLLNLLDPSNTVDGPKADEDLFGEIRRWAPTYEDLLGSPISYPFPDDAVMFDVPLTLVHPDHPTSTPDASDPARSSPGRKSQPVAHVSAVSCLSEPLLCAEDDYDYAEEDCELFLEEQPLSATRLTPSPPLSEACSSPSARDFGTPSPAAEAASPADSSSESDGNAVVETGAHWTVARVEIEVEFEDAESDVDGDGETEAESELDEDADGEWDPDCEPAVLQPGPRLMIRLPARCQSTAASSIPSSSHLPPSTHKSESDSEDGASESESDDEDGDYGGRTRPRSAPAAKRRRNDLGNAIPIATPKTRRAAGKPASAEQMILSADTPTGRPTFKAGLDGRWHCPLAAKGCPHPSFKNRDGLWRHWADHLPPQPTMCPTRCGKEFKRGRRDVIMKHIRRGCKATEGVREKCLNALLAQGKRRSEA